MVMPSGGRRISLLFFKARAKRSYLDHNGGASPAAAGRKNSHLAAARRLVLEMDRPAKTYRRARGRVALLRDRRCWKLPFADYATADLDPTFTPFACSRSMNAQRRSRRSATRPVTRRPRRYASPGTLRVVAGLRVIPDSLVRQPAGSKGSTRQ